MKIETFSHRTDLPVTPATAYDWHTRKGAFERLTPPWENIEVLNYGVGVAEGSQIELRVSLGPIKRKWLAEHRDVRPSIRFQDTQIAGPFPRWVHTHLFESRPQTRTRLLDQIEYALPFGSVGRLLASAYVRNKLEQLFYYRQAILLHDLFSLSNKGKECMNILMTGSSGLIGSALIPLLTTAGHAVTRLKHRSGLDATLEREKGTDGLPVTYWDPDTGRLDLADLEGFDAVVHLAGENIAAGRWSPARKERIRASRTNGTRLLCEKLGSLRRKPRVLISASAIGFYGDRGSVWLNEMDAPGDGYLPEVCRDWEALSGIARLNYIRVVNLRFGIVLTPRGGALAKMLTPFKWGLGGRIGNGSQFMSWVAIDDAVGAIHEALTNEMLEGPVNVVAPQPVTNLEFTNTLGRVLHRPTLLPVPALAARLALGEMAEALLLGSQRVFPDKLNLAGYAFRFPELEGALRHVLGRRRKAPEPALAEDLKPVSKPAALTRTASLN